MNKVNTLTICKDNYEDDVDFECAVGNAVMFLLKNDYIMTVRYDANDKEMGIVCIDYESSYEEWGCPYPHWLLPKQAEAIENMKESD